jgi:hypothetical protein
MRWESIEDYIVFKAEFKDFERFMRFKAIIYENSRFVASPVPCLGIEYMLNPIQANNIVCISS